MRLLPPIMISIICSGCMTTAAHSVLDKRFESFRVELSHSKRLVDDFVVDQEKKVDRVVGSVGDRINERVSELDSKISDAGDAIDGLVEESTKISVEFKAEQEEHQQFRESIQSDIDTIKAIADWAWKLIIGGGAVGTTAVVARGRRRKKNGSTEGLDVSDLKGILTNEDRKPG